MTSKEAKETPNTTIRITKESMKILSRIARKLFMDNTEEHEAIGLHRPSTRVAIDYVIATSVKDVVHDAGTTTEANNLWLRISSEKQEAK